MYKRQLESGDIIIVIHRERKACYMDIVTLGKWLWDAACSIRGPLDAPKYKDYILPLLFYKRLSDVYEDELARLIRELERQMKQAAEALEFEKAALLRDQIFELRGILEVKKDAARRIPEPVRLDGLSE